MKNKGILVFLLLIFFIGSSNPGVIQAEASKEMEGDGTKNFPFQITNEQQLATLATSYTGEKYYQLMNDIELKSEIWTPIDFEGDFDGRGYKISNVKIMKDAFLENGLFGENRGIIKNLGVENVDISVSNLAGGLVAHNSGIVENCYSTGRVESKENTAGGLIGKMIYFGSSKVINSYSMASVCVGSKEFYSGALVGELNGSIIRCYAAGNINLPENIGQKNGLYGFLEEGESKIEFSYYGSSATKTKTSYETWDFSNIWDIKEGRNQGYPYLKIFYVEKKPNLGPIEKIDITNAFFSSLDNYVYTGKAVKPDFDIQVNGKTLEIEKDYTLSYKNNKLPGQAEVTIRGKNHYTGKKKASFVIVPKRMSIRAKSNDSGKIKVEWKLNAYASGYRLLYTRDFSFKKDVNSVIIKNKKLTKLNVAKLTSGKDYYIKLCSFITVDGKKYYSNYSETLKVKAK